MMSSRMRRTILARTDTRQRTILYVLTLKCCVSKHSRLKRTSTGRRGIAMSLSTRFKDCGRPSVRTQPLWRPNELTSAHTRQVSAVSRASKTMLLLNSTRRTTRSWRESRELRIPPKPFSTSELRPIVSMES